MPHGVLFLRLWYLRGFENLMLDMATDEPRLFRYCLARAHEREFFIRKAIGWALREYAKTDPDAVRRFVLDNREVWSGLTYREATKHLEVPPR